jgi:ABC-type Fe3+/spermidine/putrescine transport system ATPase subunit
LGITFVLVTHDQEEAPTLSDRVAVMANGRVIQVDTPAGLYDQPKTRQVAAFVGTMNFFDGTLRADGGVRLADVAGIGQVALTGAAASRNDGDRVLVALRPEGMALSRTRPGGPVPAVQGKLQARQCLGGRQLLHVAVAGCAAPVAVSAAASRGEDPRSGCEGCPVWLTWAPDAVTVLD